MDTAAAAALANLTDEQRARHEAAARHALTGESKNKKAAKKQQRETKKKKKESISASRVESHKTKQRKLQSSSGKEKKKIPTRDKLTPDDKPKSKKRKRSPEKQSSRKESAKMRPKDKTKNCESPPVEENQKKQQKPTAVPGRRKGLPPADRLAERLCEFFAKDAPRGWRRREMIKLGITDKKKQHSKAEIPRMNDKEKFQLSIEVALLRQYLSNPQNANHYVTKDTKNGKFVKRDTKWNPISIRYLVMHAWGLSNSFLTHMEQRYNEEEDDLLIFVKPDKKQQHEKMKKKESVFGQTR